MLPKREPVRVITRRSTALGVALVATLVSAATFVAPSFAIPPKHPVPQLVFPIVGPATYHDDFGDPRGNGKHEGNDMMAAWRSPAVAAEAGKIKFWTKSARAGCMLYLYGKSGTSYQYIHLNNDLTEKHDNKGKCVAGTAYMDGLKDGANVQAGQQIGYVGDSGDAEGTYHLHFEVHPNDGKAVSPFSYLQKAVHLLVPVNPKLRVTLSVQGHVARYAANRMTVSLTSMTLFPGGQQLSGVKSIVLSVPTTAQVDTGDGTVVTADATSMPDLAGRNVVVLTAPARATLAVAGVRPGALAASRIAAVTQAPPGGP